jgi:hypothetical protein
MSAEKNHEASSCRSRAATGVHLYACSIGEHSVVYAQRLSTLTTVSVSRNPESAGRKVAGMMRLLEQFASRKDESPVSNLGIAYASARRSRGWAAASLPEGPFVACFTTANRRRPGKMPRRHEQALNLRQLELPAESRLAR